jgi:hypothetical protein
MLSTLAGSAGARLVEHAAVLIKVLKNQHNIFTPNPQKLWRTRLKSAKPARRDLRQGFLSIARHD